MFRLKKVSSYMYFKNGKIHAIPLELLIPESVELGLMMLYYITYLVEEHGVQSKLSEVNIIIHAANQRTTERDFRSERFV